MTCARPSSPSRAPRELEPRTASKPKSSQDARDQLAVEALADEDHGAGVAEVDRAGQDALVPEAEDLGACTSSPRRRGVTPSSAMTSKRQVRPSEPEQRPDHARNDGQHKALDEGESGLVFGGHSSILAELAELAVLAVNG